MARKVVPAAASVPLAALVLAACVSQSAYDEQASQLAQTQAQIAAQQAEIAKMQAGNKWVMAGDLLFPEGGYELSASGQAALSQYVPQLKSVQNVKVVVYGFTCLATRRHCRQPRSVVSPCGDRRRISPV
jgi:chemotaxis protein MotB